ncbi:MAG: Fic family protein [Chloroflexi bacterium]|nr:Fic family protein [Chloroflexota bacterium]
MDIEQFRDSPSGRLLKGVGGYWAFVPHPMPPPLDFTPELVSALSEADRALGELAGIGRTLPNPYLLIRPFVRREAVLSSRIEGTQASLAELFAYEVQQLPLSGIGRPSVKSDLLEVANYVRASEYGLERLNSLPLSLRLIRELHGRLMEGVRGEHLTPGEFRRRQNWIGSHGCTLDEATFVPPPVPEMNEALDALEKFLHAPSQLPPLLRIALIHYQFEAIHPFLDGNGRIGRLLITLLLTEGGILSQPLLYLSAYFEKHRQEYYDRLLAISQQGDWKGWLTFFFRGVAEQAHDAVARSQRLQDLQRRYRAKFQVARSSALLLKLVDEVLETPFLTLAWAQKRLDITHRSAQLNVEKLIGEGILREVTGRRRNRLFVADEVLRTVEEPLGGNP